MRLGVTFAQPTVGVDRGYGVIGGHGLLAALDHLDLEIDHAGQQQAVLADDAADAGAGKGRIAARSHLRVIALRIAIAQIVRDPALGPQDQALPVGLERGAQPRNPLELFLEP